MFDFDGINCWEARQCSESIRNSCPAYTQNRGKECWKLTGTLCDSGRLNMKSEKEKIEYCKTHCVFYQIYAKKD